MSAVSKRDPFHPSKWTLAELRYELAIQGDEDGFLFSRGLCGHDARGGGYCAKCLRAEIEARGRR